MESTTKTNDIRYILIPEETMELLKLHRKEQLLLKQINGDRWIETGFVFTRDNGEPVHPDSITGWLSGMDFGTFIPICSGTPAHPITLQMASTLQRYPNCWAMPVCPLRFTITFTLSKNTAPKQPTAWPTLCIAVPVKERMIVHKAICKSAAFRFMSANYLLNSH